jgi:hypothetical protein
VEALEKMQVAEAVQGVIPSEDIGIALAANESLDTGLLVISSSVTRGSSCQLIKLIFE